ncbi:MAG: helix-turn-helix domain-containing GNAT family N-acetyltransferase [Bryobacteraceae bacterium]|jgi:DNA-binding MarR family transcriptional regulator/N-acetylglutamate synthase-like GNAT family acetyltransferase
MSVDELAPLVEAVRHFNRFYTRRIGVLQEGLLQSPFSLAQARVLYELAHRENPAASELAKDLGLDAGYLSRILKGFEKRALVRKSRSESDARQSILSLTAKGRRAFAVLDAHSSEEVRSMAGKLASADRGQLAGAMQTIERLLDGDAIGAAPAVPYVLRPHQPGDMGWVAHRHAVLYAQEYGWDESFEAFVAEIAAKFIRKFDPQRERCWMAERAGEVVGSVFLVKRSKNVAQLRLLLVEPGARGLGIGRRLVEECVRFARQRGYRKIVLWTNDLLTAARNIYERAGFRLVEESRHHSFGKDLVGQNWELEL